MGYGVVWAGCQGLMRESGPLLNPPAPVIVPHMTASATLHHVLPLTLPDRPFWLLRHKQRYRSRAGDAFLEMAKP